MHAQYSPRSLPESLQGLIALALDLRWSWYHGADRLWRSVDAALWEATANNPWLLLQQIPDQRIAELAKDQLFLRDLNEHLAAQERHLSAETWFSRTYVGYFVGTVAYFSM